MTNKRYIARLYHQDKMGRRDITVEDKIRMQYNEELFNNIH